VGKKMPENKITRQLAALLLLLLTFAAPGFVHAQDKSDSGLRTVSGAILDKGETPLRDAVVYLQNVRTLTVKTYISNADGQYRFSGLDPNVDYEIHAEHDDLTSANHTISSFDSRKEINVTLKIDKQKKAKGK
jgi:hypothetical protein